MIKSPNTKLYQNPEKSEKAATKLCTPSESDKPAKVIGINIIACANIIGITPAALTFNGKYCLAAAICPVAPRFAY